MRYRLASLLALLSALSTPACLPDLSGFFEGSGDTGSATGGTGGATTSNGGGGAGGVTMSTGGGTSSTTSGSTSSTTTSCDATDPNADTDKDGATPAQGDCNDCDPEIGPGAIELPGNAIDDDCNGVTDEDVPTCDGDIPMETQDAVQAVYATDLCRISGDQYLWGIVQAGWTMPDGAQPLGPQLNNLHIGHGVLPNFGPNVPPRRGQKVLALSTGTARRPNDPGYQSVQGFDKGYTSNAASGYPKETPECGGAVTGEAHDALTVALLVRAPTNVHGFSFDFSFYVWDLPQFVCSQYNDTFFAYLNPAPPGFMDGNVGYDELGAPVTLNGANFRVCGCMNGPPCNAASKSYMCPLGVAQLAGTGFEQPGDPFLGRGATGWLTTTVPVQPGSQISLRWGVYEGGDGIGDTTVILDNWRWIAEDGVTGGTKIAQ